MNSSNSLTFGLLVGLTLNLIAAGGASADGTNTGGGGDNPPPTAESAWFLGSRTINYCFDVAPGFGVSADIVQSEIAQVLATWFKYVDVKGVNRNKTADLQLAVHSSLKSVCDGSEDLAFHFGSATPEIEKAKQKFYNPTSFAYRSSYDASQGWGKGFIWLTQPNTITQFFPDWTQANVLHAFLLHEVGHVLGNGHVPGTIMDAGISDRLQGSTNDQHAWLKHIDGYVELYSCEDCKNPGFVSPNAEEARDTFRKFAGRAAQGEVRATFSIQPDAELTLKDDRGAIKVPFLLPSEGSDVSGSSLTALTISCFKVSRGNGYSQRHLEAGVFYAHAKQASGKAPLIMIEYNLENPTIRSPSVIWYLEGGKRKLLYYQAVEL